MKEIVSPDELLRRANAIRALVASEAYKWLIDAARTDCNRDWEGARTVDEREYAFQRLLGVKSLEKMAQVIVDRGTAAARQMEQEQRQREAEEKKQQKKL